MKLSEIVEGISLRIGDTVYDVDVTWPIRYVVIRRQIAIELIRPPEWESLSESDIAIRYKSFTSEEQAKILAGGVYGRAKSVKVCELIHGDKFEYENYIEDESDPNRELLCDINDVSLVARQYFPPQNAIKYGRVDVRGMSVDVDREVKLRPGTSVYSTPPARNTKDLKVTHVTVEDDVAEYTGEFVEEKSGPFVVRDKLSLRVRSAYGDWEGWVRGDDLLKRGIFTLTSSQLVTYAVLTSDDKSPEAITRRIIDLSGVSRTDAENKLRMLLNDDDETLVFSSDDGVQLTQTGQQVAREASEKIMRQRRD